MVRRVTFAPRVHIVRKGAQNQLLALQARTQPQLGVQPKQRASLARLRTHAPTMAHQYQLYSVLLGITATDLQHRKLKLGVQSAIIAWKVPDIRLHVIVGSIKTRRNNPVAKTVRKGHIAMAR
jgi:hypothetical protein